MITNILMTITPILAWCWLFIPRNKHYILFLTTAILSFIITIICIAEHRYIGIIWLTCTILSVLNYKMSTTNKYKNR